jgi:PAS domain S-box-containing protein
MTSVAAPVADRVERALARTIPDIVLLASAEFNIEYVSANASTALGWTTGQLEGRSLLDLVHTEDQLVVAEALEAVRAQRAGSEGAIALEMMSVRVRDGNGRWARVTARGGNLIDDPKVGGIIVLVRGADDPLAEAFGELAAKLTPREREVVRLVTDGYRVSTIARELGLAPSTVRNHLSAIFHKLGVANQSQLVERLAHAAGRG